MSVVKPSHKCPAPECTVRVDNARLACVPHWFALPMHIRQMIWRTARYPVLHPVRREALDAAREEWRVQLEKSKTKTQRRRPSGS